MRKTHYNIPFRITPRPAPADSAEGLCWRCGMRGPHVSWSECIASLRDTIAELEIRGVREQPTKQYRRLAAE